MAAESRSRTLLASASRSATTSSDVVVTNARQIVVVLDVTDVTALPSVTLTIKGFDPTSGKTWNILVGAAVTTVSTNLYKVSPHLTASANAVAQDAVPPFVQVTVTANNANAGTYSVGLLECV